MSDLDHVDLVVQRAAPPTWGHASAASCEAVALAHAVAANPRRPRRRLRAGLAAVLLGAGLFGFGATAAFAGPDLLEWVGWTPDAAAQRSFTLDGDDLGLCQVAARIVPDYQTASSNKEAEARTEEARRFLATHDWSNAVAQITAADLERAVQAKREAVTAAQAQATTEGRPVPPDVDPGTVASLLMGDQITKALTDAGHFQSVSIEMAGRCDRAGE